MSLKEYLKENVWEFVGFIIIFILPFLIFESISLKIFVFILTSILTLFCFYYSFLNEVKIQKIIVSLKFFSSYLLRLNDGHSLKNCYESSIKPLIGYYEIISFEKILEKMYCPYDLKKYKSYFIYTLEKEKINEVQLPNYIPLQEDIDEIINYLSKEINKAKKEKVYSIVVVLIFALLSILIKIFDSTIFITLNKNYIKYLLVFLEILIIPIIEYIYIVNLERANNHV